MQSVNRNKLLIDWCDIFSVTLPSHILSIGLICMTVLPHPKNNRSIHARAPEMPTLAPLLSALISSAGLHVPLEELSDTRHAICAHDGTTDVLENTNLKMIQRFSLRLSGLDSRFASLEPRRFDLSGFLRRLKTIMTHSYPQSCCWLVMMMMTDTRLSKLQIMALTRASVGSRHLNSGVFCQWPH